MTFGRSSDDLIAAMSDFDAAIAREAVAKDLAIEIYEFKDGTCLLISAGGRRIHPDPAADKAYRDGYKDTYDLSADTKYSAQRESGNQ